MSFDPDSAVLDVPDAPAAPVATGGGFDPSTAKPEASSAETADKNFDAQWEQADTPEKKIAVVKSAMALANNNSDWWENLKYGVMHPSKLINAVERGVKIAQPVQAYEKGVEQSFERPAVLKEIPAIETDKTNSGVAQVGAAVANTGTGLVNAMQSAGGASLAINPAAMVYAAPFFAAKTWESAKQTFSDFASAIHGGDVSSGKLAKGVLDTALGALATTGGLVHGVKATGEMVRDPLNVNGSVTAPDAMAEPMKTAGAQPPAAAAPFDPASAKPVGEVVPSVPAAATTPFDPSTAKPVSEEDTAPPAPKETVARAAVQLSDGTVITGKTHGEIAGNLSDEQLSGADDGFVTSTGRYVNREDGMKLAKQAEQVSEGNEGPDRLHSEHLDESQSTPPMTTETEAPVVTASDVAKMSPDEFQAFARSNDETGGFTPKAHEEGIAAIGKPDAIAELKNSKKAAEDQYALLMKAGDLDNASIVASKVQYFREAVEAAENTGSAAGEPAVAAAHGETNFGLPPEEPAAAPPATQAQPAGSVQTDTALKVPVTDELPFEDISDKAKGRKVGEFGVLGEAPPEPPKYGIAARVSDERAEGGHIEPVEPGEGISAEDSVEHGRDLLEAGRDPQAVIDKFNVDHSISGDGIALVRAHGELLAKAARDAGEKFGYDSAEYKRAAEEDSAWIQAIKPLQTEWHKAGQAMQGGTDLDTGDFHSMRTAFKEATGRDFTPDEAEKAQKLSSKVKTASDAAQRAEKDVLENIDKGEKQPKNPDRVNRVRKYISDQADAARARIAERLRNSLSLSAVEGESVSGLLSRENLEDLGVVGADYFLTGAETLGEWSAKMTKEFGDKITPHLEQIYQAAKDTFAKAEQDLSAKNEAKYLARQKAALEKYIAEKEKQVADNDIASRKQQVNRPANPEIEGLKQRLDELRAQIEEMREKPEEQKAAEAAERRLDQMKDDIIEKQAKIDSGDVSTAPQEMNRPMSPELEQAKQQLEDLNHQIAELRKEPPAEPAPGSLEDIQARAKAYIEKGEDSFDAMRQKIAIDTGLSYAEVTRMLAEGRGTKEITNEMFAKRAAQRAAVSDAKNWLKNQATPGWLRFMRNVPRVFFIDKVLGHGTVGMITHAGLNIFDPGAWSTYWPTFFQQFKLLGMHDQGAYHEMMMENLTNDPNYITAKRAGLANDPQRLTDDYQNTHVNAFFDKLGLTGNRGFDALKLFRQARFNQIWDSLPESMKTKDQAAMMADAINHATGVVKTRFPEWTNWAFFAPKLEGSRWAWLVADPAKATRIFAEWTKATPEEKDFAMRQLKQKAAIAGVYLSLLATNQGLLSATGSTQKINFTDPRKSDFLSFKAAGYKAGVIGPLLGVVRLLANMLHAATGQRKGVEAINSRADEFGSIASSYLRGKASPFAGFAWDLASQSDFQGRPLPFSDDKVPAYLRKEGIGKYGYGEYLAQQFSPIPVSEALKEIWAKQGIDESTAAHYTNALLSGVVMGATGARMSRDYSVTPAQVGAKQIKQIPVSAPREIKVMK